MISVENRIFSHPRVFNRTGLEFVEGFPPGIGYRRRGQKTRIVGLPGRTRRLTISSAFWIQSTNVTDGRTDTGRQQDRAYA